MKLLEDRIRRDGVVRAGNVLKVDSFLNHQMDVELIDEIGKECGVDDPNYFSRLFKTFKVWEFPASILNVTGIESNPFSLS